MGAPILIGRTVGAAGLLVDMGEEVDYLIVKNKDTVDALQLAFGAIPGPGVTSWEIRPNGGWDMAGMNARFIGLKSIADTRLPTDLLVWYRGINLTALGLNEGDPIPLWPDATGGGADMTAAALARPTYRAAGIGGLPCAEFNGTNNWMLSGFNRNQPFTMFVVCLVDAGARAAPTLLDGNNARLYYENAANFRWEFNAGVLLPGPAEALPIAATIIRVVCDGVNSYIAKDGVPTAVRDAGAGVITNMQMGADAALNAASFFDGQIAEVQVYPELSAADIQHVENFLSRKYTIATAPPAPVVEVDLLGAQTIYHSAFDSRGGSQRAPMTYPFMIQTTENRWGGRKMNTVPVPEKGIYSDWITNSMGADGGADSPTSY